MSKRAGTLLQTIRNDYTGTNVLTSAFVQLDAILDGHVSEIEIFDSSGQTLQLAYGAASSEVLWMFIFPGGNDRGLALLPKGVRLSIKAISGNATTGELVINLWG